MYSIRFLLRLLLVVALGSLGVCQADTLLKPDDKQFMESITKDVVQASRVGVGEKVGKIGPNTTGGTLIRPGGRDCYPAFWIRDYSMSIDSGFVTLDEQRFMLMLTAQHQQDTIKTFPSGSLATVGSIPDHITFDGKSIFYPGSLDDYEGQGGERWGKLPSLDDEFFFIRMVWLYVKQSNKAEILGEVVNGKTLFQRLEDAYAMPPSNPGNGLVHVEMDNRGVTFGFVDSIIHTGDLFMCSLLKWRAAHEIWQLAELSGRKEIAEKYRKQSEIMATAIIKTFSLPSGLFKASTGLSAQPDVWGTAFAVYEGLPLDLDRAMQACKALATAYRAGRIAWQGNIRHVPTTDDFSATTSWEETDFAYNKYQNGAYWGTPTGWVCYAIWQVDKAAAKQLAEEYIAELRAGDFRKGEAFGSPWECMHPQDSHRQNPVYMTTVTCPFVAFQRIETPRESR